jgi:glycosyltransferase involved in cell wall biosynthesis
VKILSLSSVFPNPAEPGLGLFVRSRLLELARLAEVKVIAPIPLIDYSNPKGIVYRRRTESRWDGPVEVLHLRWLFPPGGTPCNVACLAARLYPVVARLRERFAFDLIDAHFGYPEGAAAALIAAAVGVPFSITLRGSEKAFAEQASRRGAIRFALRRAAAIIGVAEDLRQFAVEMGASETRARTIPNGVDASIFHRRDRRAMRERHGLPKNRKIIVSAGELIEAKGHHLVVRALGELIRQGQDAELLIVGGVARGGARFETALRRVVAQERLASRVRFVGWADRMTVAELLAAADVFCLASYTEGWPNVLNEALACGAPVVASDVGGVPAMLPEPRYGLIVPAKDQGALHQALADALRMNWNRNEIAEWGCRRPWSTVAAEVLDAFEHALAARKYGARSSRHCCSQ